MKRYVAQLALALAVCVGAASAYGAAYSWNGGAGDGNWSTAGNWTGGVPASANDSAVTFGAANGVEISMPAAITAKSLFFSGSAGSYTLGKTGESSTITFDSNSTATTTVLSVAVTNPQVVNGSIVIANSASVTATTAIDSAKALLTVNGNLVMNTATRLQAAGGILLNGVISGDAGGGAAAMDVNTGTVTFAGVSANTMTCRVNVASGATLILAKPAGVTAIGSSSININTNAVMRLDAANQIGDSTELSMRGGRLNVNGKTETVGKITLSSGSSTLDLGAGSLEGLTISSTAGGAAGVTLTVENWVADKNYLRSLTAPTSTFLTYTSFAGYGSGAAATLKDGYYYITPAAVPEAASLGVLGMGAALVVGGRRR